MNKQYKTKPMNKQYEKPKVTLEHLVMESCIAAASAIVDEDTYNPVVEDFIEDSNSNIDGFGDL